MREIRKEIVIAASIDRIWEHLTDPSRIAGWFLPNDFEPQVGTRFTLSCPDQGRIACEVKEVIPQRKLVYTFKPSAVPFETVVTFALEPVGTETRVTLVHSGWENLTPEQAELFGTFDRGWQRRFLAQLKSTLEEKR